MPDERAVIHSYGGGVQSAAMAVLVVTGKLPRPERIIMADTGREAALTWRYLDDSIQPMLRCIGLTVEIAPHSLATVDMYARSGDGRPQVPAYDAAGGRLPNYCSVEWKRRVVHRWLRREGYGPRRPVIQWLGISTNEIHRVKPSAIRWASIEHPLIGLGLSRADCIRIVERHGLPTPPRSSCYMCPFRSDAEWLALRQREDGDWQRAVAVDDEIRSAGNGSGDLFLHRSLVPLRDATFRHERQTDLFDVCEEGRCEF